MSLKSVFENGYLRDSLIAFNILKMEEVSEFRNMNGEFKSFKWGYEFLEIVEKKLSDRTPKIAVEALKIIQNCMSNLLVETKPNVKRF